MNGNAQPEGLALLVAEEVLRTIYGDDFKGCTVSPDAIARIIREAICQSTAKEQAVIGMYEKVVQAIHRLSTPPAVSNVADPKALDALLSERLDAIHNITTQTIGTTERLADETGR